MSTRRYQGVRLSVLRRRAVETDAPQNVPTTRTGSLTSMKSWRLTGKRRRLRPIRACNEALHVVQLEALAGQMTKMRMRMVGAQHFDSPGLWTRPTLPTMGIWSLKIVYVVAPYVVRNAGFDRLFTSSCLPANSLI